MKFQVLYIVSLVLYLSVAMGLENLKTTCATEGADDDYVRYFYSDDTVVCNGEVRLRGLHINVGVHRVGSFGTVSAFNTSFGSEQQLGLVADRGNDEWILPADDSTPINSDFVIPGFPLEGWRTT